ncbi:MAG: hypothetical protein Q4E68_00505 [Prevotellaceae bacterium]|mgnify:FL=1|nr:hypothetical protein [Prevotellaceae bacterium]
MNKKYIKPSIVVEATLLKAVMETVSVIGDMDDSNKNNFQIDAKGTSWDDEEE